MRAVFASGTGSRAGGAETAARAGGGRNRLSLALAVVLAAAVAARSDRARADIVVQNSLVPVTIFEGDQSLVVQFAVVNFGPNDVLLNVPTLTIVPFGVDPTDDIFNPVPFAPFPNHVAPGMPALFAYTVSTNQDGIPENSDIGGNHLDFRITGNDAVTGEALSAAGAYTVFVQDVPEPPPLVLFSIAAAVSAGLVVWRTGQARRTGPAHAPANGSSVTTQETLP